jgi:pentapeptide MXKDX repeat protein
MRKLIIATVALAFVSSTAFAQDKAGDKSGTAPAAASGDTMSKDTMKKTTKKKKSAKKNGDDAMTKQ